MSNYLSNPVALYLVMTFLTRSSVPIRLSKSTLLTAETWARFLAIFLLQVTAMMGQGGLNLDSLSAEYPLDVNTMITVALIWYAA